MEVLGLSSLLSSSSSSSSSSSFSLHQHRFIIVRKNREPPSNLQLFVSNQPQIYTFNHHGQPIKSNPKENPQNPTTHLHLFKTLSQNPLIYSSSFLHNLKLPSLQHPIQSNHSHPLPHAIDSVSNSDTNPKSVYIQEPTFLLMENFYKSHVKKRIKVEIDKRNYYILRRRQIKVETKAWDKMTEEYMEFQR